MRCRSRRGRRGWALRGTDKFEPITLAGQPTYRGEVNKVVNVVKRRPSSGRAPHVGRLGGTRPSLLAAAVATAGGNRAVSPRRRSPRYRPLKANTWGLALLRAVASRQVLKHVVVEGPRCRRAGLDPAECSATRAGRRRGRFCINGSLGPVGYRIGRTRRAESSPSADRCGGAKRPTGRREDDTSASRSSRGSDGVVSAGRGTSSRSRVRCAHGPRPGALDRQ
jgi:hypothetical protein